MEQVSIALEPVRSFLIQLGEFLPKLLLAIAILVAGWLLAKILYIAVVKGLRALKFNVLTESAGIDAFLKQGGLRKDTTELIAMLIYWLVILAALVIGFNTMGLAYVTDLLGQITRFIPKVIVAVLILAVGLYFARFVGDAVTAYARNIGMEDGNLMGRLSRYAIVVFVILIALDQVQVGGEIIQQTFLIIIAGVVLALALAFGLGGQKWAAGQLEKLQKGEGRGRATPRTKKS
jgi:hypothetical protein